MDIPTIRDLALSRLGVRAQTFDDLLHNVREGVAGWRIVADEFGLSAGQIDAYALAFTGTEQ